MLKFKKISAITLSILFVLLTACTNTDKTNAPGGTSVVSGVTSYQPTVKPDGSVTLKPEEPSVDTTEEHVDADDNGICDKCKKSVMVYIDFYNINDLHGKVKESATQPGIDELSTYFKFAYQTEKNVVVLSSGDMWQGSAESGLTKGKVITEWMNYIGFEAMTLGNHEFDWGTDDIEANSKIADFPLLAINVYAKNDNERVDYCKSSVLIERDGIKIGIIGAAGNNYSSIAPDMVQDVYFKTGDELTKLVKAESEKLKSQGAQIIVYSLHDGYSRSSSGTGMIADTNLEPYYDISLSSGGYVDIVFEAHTHQNYILKDAYGVYHMQGGGENKGLSHIEFSVNSVTGSHKAHAPEFVQNSFYGTLSDDPIIETLLNKYSKDLAIANKVLGTTSKKYNSSEIRNLVAKLYYEEGVKKWGSKYDIVLGGGYLSIRSPYELSSGEITYSMLYSLLTFDNELVLCSIKGSDLKKRFFTTENYYTYSTMGRYDFEDNKTYYVIVDSYSSTYKPNKLTEIERYGEDVYARDLLAEYIMQGKLK